MPVIDAQGDTGFVEDRYFAALQRLRGEDACAHTLGGRMVALSSPLGVNGIDNGWNLLETALAAFPGAVLFTTHDERFARTLARDRDRWVIESYTRGSALYLYA